MYGGDGSDIYVTDSAADVITESGTSGLDTVISGVTWTLGSTLENLTLSGTAVINGTGNSAANLLTGNGAANALGGGSGNDTLLGGDGNDLMNGGAGVDSLTGSNGADQFIWKATSESTLAAQDRVADFNHTQADQFDLTAIDAKSDGTSNDAFSFISTAFTGVTGQVHAVVTSGGMLIEADTNGDKTADLVIFVAGATSIVAGDFLL